MVEISQKYHLFYFLDNHHISVFTVFSLPSAENSYHGNQKGIASLQFVIASISLLEWTAFNGVKGVAFNHFIKNYIFNHLFLFPYRYFSRQGK